MLVVLWIESAAEASVLDAGLGVRKDPYPRMWLFVPGLVLLFYEQYPRLGLSKYRTEARPTCGLMPPLPAGPAGSTAPLGIRE